MRWTAPLLAIVLSMAAPATLAAASGDAVELTVIAEEDDCPGEASFCYEVTEGSLSQIEPGSQVEITLENHGDTEHELMVRTLAGERIAPPSMMGASGHEDAEHASSQAAHGEETSAEEHNETEAPAENGAEPTDDGDHTTSQDQDEGHTNGTEAGSEEESHREETHRTGEAEHDDANSTHADGEDPPEDPASHQDSHDGTHEQAQASMDETGMAGGHGDHLVAPGASRTITFTVPEDAEGVYLWCSLPGHEELGMQEEAAFHTQAGGEGVPVETSLPAVPLLIGMTFLGAIGILLWDRRYEA